MTGPTGFITAVGVWIAFSVWFLTSRRIGSTAWRVRQETVTAGSETAVAATTPVEAMQRWLLSSGTPLTLGLQWGLAMLVLLGVQLAVPRLIGGDSPRRALKPPEAWRRCRSAVLRLPPIVSRAKRAPRSRRTQWTSLWRWP